MINSNVEQLQTDISNIDTANIKKIQTSETLASIYHTTTTTEPRSVMRSQYGSSYNTIGYFKYDASSNITDRVELRFNGTDFIAVGQRDGADSVSKKLGSSGQYDVVYVNKQYSANYGNRTKKYSINTGYTGYSGLVYCHGGFIVSTDSSSAAYGASVNTSYNSTTGVVTVTIDDSENRIIGFHGNVYIRYVLWKKV